MKPETASRAAPAPPSTAHNASIAFGRPSRQQDEFRRSQEDSEKESPTPLFSGKERPRRRQEERRRREERGDVRQSPSLWRKAHIINKFMSLASPSSRRRRLLNSDARTTAATTTTATTKMPLIPRRDFTGFNTMSRRRTWRRQGTNELTGIMNREAIKASLCLGLSYSKMRAFLLRSKQTFYAARALLFTVHVQSISPRLFDCCFDPRPPPPLWACPPPGELTPLTWLGFVCDPVLPDPAHERKFAVFWFDKISETGAADTQRQKIDSLKSRYILRQLDKLVSFPEQTAVLLMAAETEILGDITVKTLLSGLTHPLSSRENEQEEERRKFHRLALHFYLVSEWVVQLVISQSGHASRRAVLACILRIAQASWNMGNFNGVMEILMGLRSPALKPLWLSLSGSDADTVFCCLFRKLFCHYGREYLARVSGFLRHGQPVVPAFFVHLKALANSLGEAQASCLLAFSQTHQHRIAAQVLADFHGERNFLSRIAEPGIDYTSALKSPRKLKMFQATLDTVAESMHDGGSSSSGDEMDTPTDSPTALHERRSCSLTDSRTPQSVHTAANHKVTMVEPGREDRELVEFLHHGTTVLHYETDSQQVVPVFLKLERCNGTITWCRPLWGDPRRSAPPVPDGGIEGTGLDTIEDAVSPGLRLKYTNRSGESLAYADEGYVDLMHMKDLSLSVSNADEDPECVRVAVQRGFGGVVHVQILRIVFGSTLAENRTVHFLCPAEIAAKWFAVLPTLSRAIKAEDPRMVWLKDQYLFLYFQDDLCMGPLAADAIKSSYSQDPAVKVFGGRSWSLSGMLKDRGNKGSSWNNQRMKKKSYGNIHSINDRGIHEIYETIQAPAGSAPTSPWTSPVMARRSGAQAQLPQLGVAGDGLLSLRTGSITHGSELSFIEFLDLFKSFSLRLRKDIRNLFSNHSVCNVTSPEDLVKGTKNASAKAKSPKDDIKRAKMLCSLTRNSSTDLTDFKTRNDKKKVFDAMASASIFNNSAGVDTSRARVIPIDSFMYFLEHFQKDDSGEREAKNLIELHEPDPLLRQRFQLSFEGFARYLMDSANTALEVRNNDDEEEDMNQSMARYFIATSHNTYLVGHQLKGLSSVHLYREILLTGCRCVELDCWDGDDGHPIIYHGHTLTTKISFREVVQTIAESAFVASPYPVILSIENHCSIPQQQKMANIFKELLGDRLVTAPVMEGEMSLPSPNQLKYRIILKNKKLLSGSLYKPSRPNPLDEQDEDDDSDYGEEDYEDDIQDDIAMSEQQNMTLEEYQQNLRQSRPLTLSLQSSNALLQMEGGKKKKERCQIARELSDLVVYCQSVKFKGFGKELPPQFSSDSPANKKRPDATISTSSGTPVTPLPMSATSAGVTIGGGGGSAGRSRTTGALKSLESTPSSSSGSLCGSAMSAVPTVRSSSDLRHPIYKCYSLHESRSKTLCRKHSQRMLELTETQLVRVYPAGMRIDSSNFNPVSMWASGIQMVAMNYQTPDANIHLHNSMFAGSGGFVLKPTVMWSPSHILYQRFLPASKNQVGLHATQISLTVVSGQYACRENYGASPCVEIEVLGIPRDSCKHKTKVVTRNALNPIWEETFELVIFLPELAFIRFSIFDMGGGGSGGVAVAQRVIPVQRLRPGYRHIRLHNELDQPLPLSQLFLCTQFLDGDLVMEDPPQFQQPPLPPVPKPRLEMTRKRLSFLVVHDISDSSPYAILKVPENATTRDVIKQAVAKAGTSGHEHEYVLLEEVLAPSVNGDDFLTAPPTQQRMVGMDECPLHIRNQWKSDSKFVLKRVGADPSWRARLGNLMIQETNQQLLSRRESLDAGQDEGRRTADVDNFLVCVFNVSSKVSYSILQVAKTSTASDVISLALSKSRRSDTEGEPQRPERFFLVEETDMPSSMPLTAPAFSDKKLHHKGKRRRILEPDENVYLVQLGWKGGGRLILEEREKLLREGGHLHLDVPPNSHLHICETHSDPLALAGKMSPRIRRSSKMIASGVRRLSRSFYGNDGATSSSATGSSYKQRRMTTASGSVMSVSPSSPSLRDVTRDTADGEVAASAAVPAPSRQEDIQYSERGRKLSKVNLRKLKIW